MGKLMGWTRRDSRTIGALGTLCLLQATIALANSIESSGNSTASEARTAELAGTDSAESADTRAVDSYLEAWRHSRTSTDPREGIVAVEDPVSTLHRRRERPVYAAKRSEIATDRDSYSMVPSDSYTLPNRARVPSSYGPPRETYGAPASGEYTPYGNAGFYSPPVQQAYGPPAAPGYGSSVPYGHGTSESYHLGIPTVDFTWPFALKLNAFTVAKILLKLIIFKMIVKFIAVICLLLFIPKLEIKKGNKGSANGGGGGDDDDDEDEGRRSMNAESIAWDRLNLLTLVVKNALERYDGENSGAKCSTIECRVQRALGRDRVWPDYEQLLRSYILEEARRIRARP